MLNKCYLMETTKRIGTIYYNDSFTKFKFELEPGVDKPVIFYPLNPNSVYNPPSELIDNFFTLRVFPEERKDGYMFLEKMGMAVYDRLEIIKYFNGVTPTDNYWIDFGKGLTWEDVRIKFKEPEPEELEKVKALVREQKLKRDLRGRVNNSKMDLF